MYCDCKPRFACRECPAPLRLEPSNPERYSLHDGDEWASTLRVHQELLDQIRRRGCRSILSCPPIAGDVSLYPSRND